MTLTVRPSTKADLAAIDALLARSYPRLLKPDYPPSVLVTALPLISRAQPALVACGTYYVAEDEGRLLGAGGWTRDRRDRRMGHIRHLVTDADATRRGVGRSVVGHALRAAGASGIRLMECWSTRTAVPFYTAMGFSVLGPMEVPLQPGITFPAVRMQMVLPQGARGA